MAEPTSEYQEPWKTLERNQKLRDGREVVDIASNTSSSPENWDIVGVKAVKSLAERACLTVNACRGIADEDLLPGSIINWLDALGHIETFAQRQAGVSDEEALLWAQVVKLARTARGLK